MPKLKCPSCDKALSFWNVAKAPTPFHLKCDHCRTKLSFHGLSWPVLVAAILFGLVLGVATHRLAALPALVGVIVAIAVFETTFFLLASVMNFRLVVRNNG
jgi:hypothetical protein